MKQLLTILLIVSLLMIPCEISQHEQAQGQATLAVLYMVCGISFGLFTIWLYKTYEQPKMRTVVLWESHYDGNWRAVDTNTLLIGPQLNKAFPAFGRSMTDGTALYKVMEMGQTPQYNVLTSDTTKWICSQQIK